MDSIRERLVGMGVDNFIGQYQNHHELNAVKLSNYMDVRSIVPRAKIADNIIINSIILGSILRIN